jgi:uncharacterized protein (TIGR03435 family)
MQSCVGDGMRSISLRMLIGGVLMMLVLVIPAWPPLARSQAAALPRAQSSDPAQPVVEGPLRFEVASIRAEAPDVEELSNRQMQRGGRFVATGTTARTFVRIALGVEDNRIVGLPKWAGTDNFAITAITANRAEVKTPQQFQQLILSLLEDRFGFKFHREKVETPVYWLELVKPGRPGPELRVSATDTQPNMSTNSNGSKTVMKIAKMSMTDVAAGLSRQAGRSVEDHTGLAGNFDFQIEWSPDGAAEAENPGLFTVLKEQLGLRLRPAKGATDGVVVDQILRPSAD